MGATTDDALGVFTAQRPRLVRIAYRMLGSVAEAEDVVQGAWLRWHEVVHAEVRDAQGFLTRMVTRMCLDVLKSARVTRAAYIGPWLPEPWVAAPEDDLHEAVTLSLMVALERLSPLERAAFLLHDVFGVGFDEVGETLGRAAPACRQLAHRARAHVRDARPRFEVPRPAAEALVSAFFEATRDGDLTRLQSLLASEVVLYSDGGGKANAARRPVAGRDRVARMYAGLVKKAGAVPQRLLYHATIDGLPGLVSLGGDGLLQTIAFELEGGLIVGIYVVRNPDKLRHVGPTGPSNA